MNLGATLISSDHVRRAPRQPLPAVDKDRLPRNAARVYEIRDRFCTTAGEMVMELIAANIRPRDIVTRRALEKWPRWLSRNAESNDALGLAVRKSLQTRDQGERAAAPSDERVQACIQDLVNRLGSRGFIGIVYEHGHVGSEVRLRACAGRHRNHHHAEQSERRHSRE